MTQPPRKGLEAVVRRLPLYALAAFLVMTAVMSAVASFAYRAVGPADGRDYLDGPLWLDAWFQGDSGWYHLIADSGYFYNPGQQSPIAFFPAYPLLVRGLGHVLGEDFSTAAGLLTLVCAAGSVMLFADWVRSRVEPRVAVTAVALLLAYPYSFFLYGSGYSDALFLLTALGSFALLERRHYVLAGLVGAMATAGRPIGVAVVAGLVVRATELIAEERAARRQSEVLVGGPAAGGSSTGWSAGETPADPRAPVPLRAMVEAVRFLRWRHAALLVSLSGLAAWTTYLGIRFGDPLAFASVQGSPGWEQSGGPRTWFKVAFFGEVYYRDWDTLVLLVPQALACLAAVLLVRTVWRRFGWGYAAYTFVSLAIPLLGTKDFMGTGRYVLAAYPILAAAAVVLSGERRQRWLAPVVLAVLVVGLCIATVGYVNGVEVS